MTAAMTKLSTSSSGGPTGTTTQDIVEPISSSSSDDDGTHPSLEQSPDSTALVNTTETASMASGSAAAVAVAVDVAAVVSTTSATSTSETTSDNESAIQTAHIAPLCHSKATNIASSDRTYRILALSVLTLAFVFGAGFGFGVLYSKHHMCHCSDREDGNLSSNASAKATNQPNKSVNTHCQGNNIPKDDISGSSSSSGSGGSSSSSGGSSSNSGSSGGGSSTLPPVIDSSFAPPVFIEEPVACLSNEDALTELRTAVTSMAQAYINQFAYYIRRGGNNSVSYDAEYYDEYEYEGLNATEYVAALTSETTSMLQARQRRRRSRQRSARARRTTSEDSATTVATRASFGSRRLRHNMAGTRRPKTTTHQRRPLSKSQLRNRVVRAQQAAEARRGQNHHRRVQSENQQSSDSTVPPAADSETTAVLQADMVQLGPDDSTVFVAYGDEILTLQSATTAIQSRMRIPKRHHSSYIDGMLLLQIPKSVDNSNVVLNAEADNDDDDVVVPVLVVLVQEWDYSAIAATSSSSGPTNTTVLVYYPNGDNESSDAFKLVQSYSLPGLYDKAFAVQGGRHLHVVTATSIYAYGLTESLTPAFLQTNSTAWYYDNGPELLLNETEYRKLAYAQFGRSVDNIVRELAAGTNSELTETNGQPLDCTGFMALSRLQSNDTNMDLIEPSSLVHFVSFDLSSTFASPYQNSRTSTMSMLPVGGSPIWNMLVTNTKLVLSFELMSGQTFTVDSLPMSWLVAFDLVNGTIMPAPTSSLVPGVIHPYIEMNQYQAQDGKDYLRFTTTRFDSLVDYFREYDEYGAFPARRTYLQILDLGHNGTGTAVVEGEWEGPFGNNSTVTSVAYTANSVVLVVGSRATIESEYSTSNTVYTIDSTDPTNPLVVGEFHMPVSSLDVYSLTADWLIVIASFFTSDEYPIPQPLQLFLWNVSNRQSPMHVAYHWIDDTELISNGTEINSTIVTSSMVNSYELANAVQYIEESKVLVIPVRTDKHDLRPCTSDRGWMYSNGPGQLNENESYHNRTCRYDYTAVFDGFWLFKVDLSVAATTTDTNSNSSVVKNMTKHFEIDHALPELLRQECSSPGDTELSTRSLAFDGDVMTFKRSAILTYDVLTKSEAAPAVILGNADCQ